MPQEIENWTEINQDFAIEAGEENYQSLWTKQNFTKSQAQQYLNQGFFVRDFMFLTWLRDNKKLLIKQLKEKEITHLRAEYNQCWAELDSSFIKRIRKLGYKTYQQIWEEFGISYEQAEEWIKLGKIDEFNFTCWPVYWMKYNFSLTETQSWLDAGLKIDNFNLAKEWKRLRFDPEGFRELISIGLNKNEYLFAFYICEKNLLLKHLNLELLRTEFYTAQNYLDFSYSNSPSLKNTTILDISKQNLTGKLNLSILTNLEELDCADNQLTKLILYPYNQIKMIHAENNLLTTFEYGKLNPHTLIELYLNNNNLSATDLSLFSRLVNLKELRISNDDQEKINQNIYNRWNGSLEPLESCSKLSILDIENTDLNAGVEYLPTSIILIFYRTDLRPNCKLKRIETFLKEWEEKRKNQIIIQSDLTINQNKIYQENLNLRKELTFFNSQLTKERENNQALQNQLIAAEKKLVEKDKILKELNEFSRSDAEIANLNLQQKEQIIHNLTQKLEEEKNGNVDDIKTLVKQTTRLENEKNFLKNELDSKNNEFKEVKNSLNERAVQLENANQKVAELSQNLERQTEIIKKIEREKNELAVKANSLEADLLGLKEEKSQLEAKKREFKENLKSSERQKEYFQNQLNKERIIHDQTKQEYKKLEKILVNQKTERAESENVFREEIEGSNNKLKNLQTDLEKVNEVIANTQKHLGLNDLISLPPMPAGTDLRTLIDHYDDTPTDWQVQIKQAQLAKEQAEQNKKAALQERNSYKSELENAKVETLNYLQKLNQTFHLNLVEEKVSLDGVIEALMKLINKPSTYYQNNSGETQLREKLSNAQINIAQLQERLVKNTEENLNTVKQVKQELAKVNQQKNSLIEWKEKTKVLVPFSSVVGLIGLILLLGKFKKLNVKNQVYRKKYRDIKVRIKRNS